MQGRRVQRDAVFEFFGAAAERIGQGLLARGWKVRLQSRETPSGTGWMVAAKTGAANKIGYLAAHAAIVIICIGGLFDGDLMVRAQLWFGGKEALGISVGVKNGYNHASPR